VSGKPGVCLTTLGPGAANALVGLAHAYLDRAPVLIITAQTNESYLPDYTHQVLDLAAIFQPVTKFSADFSHIAAAYGLDFYRVANEAACAEAVQAAVAAGRPALLEALIDPVGYPTTPGPVLGEPHHRPLDLLREKT